MRLYSRDLYARLEAETGQATGFKPVGLIEAAADADRLEEYRRVAAFQRHLGLEVEEISPAEMSKLFPWAKTDDLLAGFHVPGDGRVNPVDLTTALAKGARQLGVRVFEGVTVTDVVTERVGPLDVGHRACGSASETDRVRVRRQRHRHVGPRARAQVGPQRAQHRGRALLPDHRHHRRARPGHADLRGPGRPRLLPRGGRRHDGRPLRAAAAAWHPEGVPAGSSFTTLKPDWDRMGPFLETAMARVPVTLDAGVRTFFCGPESFTPDLSPIVGEAPGTRGYFVAAGMNSVGVLSAGGLGRVVAQWIVDGKPDVDVTGFDIDRFRALPGRGVLPRHAHHRDPRHRVRRAHARQAAALRARGQALARPRPARRQRRLPARGLGLGGRRLVRRAGRHARGDADVGARRLVRAVGGRAPHRPRAGRA